jgi:hypothetical protein
MVPWEIEMLSRVGSRNSWDVNRARALRDHELPEVERAEQIGDEIDTRGSQRLDHERRLVLA